MVRVVRLERTVSWSQTRRDTNFAIPGYSISAMIPRRGVKIKFFLSVVIHVVKAAFVPLLAIGGNPTNAGATRLCGVTNCAIPGYLILNHYSTKFVRLKDYSVCGHLCGQSRFYTAFGNRGKSSKRRCRKALRRFDLPRPGYNHGTPKAGALPAALHPVIKLFHPAGRILPNQARYQLRYTRIFNFCHDTTARGKNKVFSVCGHLCGQSRFCAVFGNRRKTRYRPCRKALRAFVQAAHG